MNDFVFTFNIIMPLFMLLVLGYILKKIKLLNDEYLHVANDLTFKVLLPVLLFTNVITSDFSEAIRPKILIFSIIAVLIIFFCSLIIVPIFSKDKTRIPVYIQGIFRSNVLLFGIPLSEMMFGYQGVAIVAVFIAIYVPVVNILSTIVFYLYNPSETKSIRLAIISVIKNPLVISGFVGILGSIIFSITNIELPYFINKTLVDIKYTATPLAFIVLGADLNLKSIYSHSKLVSIITTARLIIIPAIVIVIGCILGFNGIDIIILVVTFASPMAVSIYVMAYKANANYKLAGELIGSTTIFSIFTLFGFIYILRLFEFL